MVQHMIKMDLLDSKCFVRPDLNAAGVEIRLIPGKGRGLFATRDISEKTIIFEESPIVSCQFLWNQDLNYKACDHCLRPLETAEENIRRLVGDPTFVLTSYPELCPTRKDFQTQCQCGAQYCSSRCQELARDQYHGILCFISGDERSNQLNVLRSVWKNMHYPPETSSIVLILRLYACYHQASDKEAALLQFQDFVSDVINRSENICHKLLGEKFRNNIQLLRATVIETVQLFGLDIPLDWISEAGFVAHLALLGTNSQGIGSSAFSNWQNIVETYLERNSNADELEAFSMLTTQYYDKLEQTVGLDFLNNEGSGLYWLQSKINHSCEPNSEVAFINSNHTLAVRATSAIAAGEEICISYLDECVLGRSRASRQSFLRENYLFECTCCKCEQQAANPNLSDSSDESIYSDD